MEKIEEMVLAAQNGDKEAFNWLYEQTHERNYYIIIKMLKQEQDAMDVLQDTYIKVLQKLPSFKYNGSQSFVSWTGKIASNTALDFLRKKKPLLFSDLNTEDESIQELEFEDKSVENQPELALDQKETARIVQEMLECLSEEQRVCVILRYVRQMKISEIALECGCSENTIKSRLNYAKKRLLGEREALEKKGIHLYNVAPFTLLAFLLEKDADASQAPASIKKIPEKIIEKAFEEQQSPGFYNKGGTGGAGKASKVIKSMVVKWGAGKITIIMVALLLITGAGITIIYNALAKKGTGGTKIIAEITAGPVVSPERTSTPEPSSTPEASQTPEPAKKTEEDIYYEYMNNELIPEYGLTQLNQKGTMVYKYSSGNWWEDKKNYWLKPYGIISAYISDLDGNGSKELFVIYWDKKKDQNGNHAISASIYELEDGNVVCKDEMQLSDKYYDWHEYCASEGNFSITEMTAGKKKYLVLYQCSITAAFADGYNVHSMWSAVYKDGKLNKVRETRTPPGAVGSDIYSFLYNGYTWEDGKEKQEVLFDMEDGNAAYDNIEDAFTKFFKRDKLDVSEIIKDTAYFKKFNKTKDAKVICSLNTKVIPKGYNETETRAGMVLEGEDGTGLRKHITKLDN